MNNKSIILTGSLLSLILIVMNACYYDEVLPQAPIGEVGQMSFSGDIIPIFNASCNMSGCHNKGGQKPDLSPADAYTALVNGGYIDKATPANSSLHRWMSGEESQPMPLTGPNPTYNAKVLAWIEQGALNN